MFNRIDRYISTQIIVASLAILILISCLQALLSFLSELAQTGEGDYSLSDAILFTGLMIPSRMLEIFPMSVLIGTLSAMGTMASNSELTVMRSAGMTTWRIAGAAIKGSVLLMVLMVVTGEFIAPAATKSAQQLKTIATSAGELSISKSGLWAKRGNEIVHVVNVESDQRLSDLTFYQLSDDNQLASITRAEVASKVDALWQLQQVSVTTFQPDRIAVESEEARIWTQPIKQAQLDTLSMAPEMLNFGGLLRYLSYLGENNLETKTFELAVWRKVTQPISLAVMIFLATSFVFGPMRNVSVGARILAGVALGFGFHLANQSFGPISLVYNIWPIFGAVIPIAIFGLIGYHLMAKNK